MEYKELIEKEIEAIRRIPGEEVVKLVNRIWKCKPNRIITSGMGKAGQIAHTLATTLSSTGTPSYFIHPSEAQHGDLGSICEDDAVIVISNSGKTLEIAHFIILCRNLYPKIKIYGIIGNDKSDIEKMCDFSVIYGPVEEICPLGLTPTTSTTCMGIICDLIVVGMMKKRKFTKSDYSKRHHGGYLGLKSKEI
jgi:arabinose-5-phosphate isomerase